MREAQCQETLLCQVQPTISEDGSCEDRFSLVTWCAPPSDPTGPELELTIPPMTSALHVGEHQALPHASSKTSLEIVQRGFLVEPDGTPEA